MCCDVLCCAVLCCAVGCLLCSEAGAGGRRRPAQPQPALRLCGAPHARGGARTALHRPRLGARSTTQAPGPHPAQVATLQAGQQSKRGAKAQQRHAGGEGHGQVGGGSAPLRHKIAAAGGGGGGGDEGEWEERLAAAEEEEEDVGADYESSESGWDRPWLRLARGHILVALNLLFLAVVLAALAVRTRRRRKSAMGQRND
jgi:hypothetical protein